MTLILGLYVTVGLLLIGMSIPLILGKVGPNPWYGFRVPRTLADPAVWYPANAYAARWMLGLGILTSPAAVLLYLVPGIDLPVYASALGSLVLVGLAVALVMSFRYLKKLP